MTCIACPNCSLAAYGIPDWGVMPAIHLSVEELHPLTMSWDRFLSSASFVLAQMHLRGLAHFVPGALLLSSYHTTWGLLSGGAFSKNFTFKDFVCYSSFAFCHIIRLREQRYDFYFIWPNFFEFFIKLYRLFGHF